MKIGIGLVTYNNSSVDITRYLKSLCSAGTELSNKIQVLLFYVDNGNPSAVNELYPNAIALESAGNIGYTKAINRLMVKAFEEHKVDAFICSNGDGAFHYNTISSFLDYDNLYGQQALIEAIQFPQEHPKFYDPISFDTAWASGCCLFINKNIYKAVGLFDENFFMYLEDVDFSWRVRMAGFKIKTCPFALYGHAAMNREPSRKLEKFFLESGRYLGYKWGNKQFAKGCEDTLISKNHYKSFHDLPQISTVSAFDYSYLHQAAKVTNFRNNFNFAKIRW